MSRIILLVLDNAGWHGPANLKIPDGVRLIYLPPYSPELQPAETLWALVDEPIVNQHIATITDLDEKIAAQCIALSEAARANPEPNWLPLVAKAESLRTNQPEMVSVLCTPEDRFSNILTFQGIDGDYGAIIPRLLNHTFYPFQCS